MFFKDFLDFDGFQRILRISWIFLDFFRIFSRSVRDFWSEMPLGQDDFFRTGNQPISVRHLSQPYNKLYYVRKLLPLLARKFRSSLKNSLVHVFSKLHSKPYYYLYIKKLT